MKMKLTSLFFIKVLFLSCYWGYSQEKERNINDSIIKNNKYGLRIGIDLARPSISLFDENFSGFEFMVDYRLTSRFYIAAEYGFDQDNQTKSNLIASTKGSYFKIGGDFNAYNNWVGMNNAIYVGLRYGLSTFDQNLEGYTIYTGDSTFPETMVIDPNTYKGLNAHWAEFIFGIKTEILTNLFLSVNLQLKNKFSEDIPENFNNLYIPGFNKTNDYSDLSLIHI